jgi:integrase
MPIYFDKATARWRFSFNRVVAGRRVRATKLLPQGWTRNQAQAYEQKETHRLFSLATGDKSRRATIDDAVEIYCRERIPLLKHGYKQSLEFTRFQWAFAGRLLDELPEVAQEYIQFERERETLAAATIRNRLAYLRAACRYAFKFHKLCAHDPAERMQLPALRNERHFYCDRRQVLQIARKITNPSARVAVLVAFYSGMRLGEVLKCTVSEGMFVLEDTKNGDRRLVPAHYRLRSYLKRIPITARERTIQGCIKRAVVALGLGHLHFHDLRHSAASAMINSGIDLYTVGAVLGHRTPLSTKRYSHLATKTLAAAVATIGKKVHSAI